MYIRYNFESYITNNNMMKVINQIYEIMNHFSYHNRNITQLNSFAYGLLFEDFNDKYYGSHFYGTPMNDIKKIFNDMYIAEYGELNKESKQYIKNYTVNNSTEFPDFIKDYLKRTTPKYRKDFKRCTENLKMNIRMDEDDNYVFTF